MDDTKQDITNSTSSLMREGRCVGLSVNKEKTKYMYITRNVRTEEGRSDLDVDGISFQ